MDKATKVTFNEPVQVPGKVLPAGTYVFRLQDSTSNRHIVQIFNEDHTSLITTVLAIPNYRLQPTGKTVLTYDERPADQPMALAAWFYPGDSSGQEFAYPKSEAEQLSRRNKREVPSTGSEEAYPADLQQRSTQTASQDAQPVPQSQAPAAQPKPEPTNPPVATNPSPPPAAQAAGQGEAQLPHTATLLPLVGLIGFVLLAVGLTLRRALRA